MLRDEKLFTQKLKDIATFEHYKPSWDKVIFDIIEKGETSVFDIQEYFNYYNYGWEIFLDALAYFRYVDFLYPNLTVQHGGNYITIYTYINLTCCIPQIYTMLYVKYISIKK